MRINKYVALATGISRRKADEEILAGNVLVNKQPAVSGRDVSDDDVVLYGNKQLRLPKRLTTIIMHKPTGYVCSRNGQGGKTVYDLLPKELHHLKTVGRLDKDSTGLLLLTNDGALANNLTHPTHAKTKVYTISLDKPLTKLDWSSIHERGIELEDGPSKLFLERLEPFDNKHWQTTMREGKNRQIRRTFAALGYTVIQLHRTHFGPYSINNIALGSYVSI